MTNERAALICDKREREKNLTNERAAFRENKFKAQMTLKGAEKPIYFLTTLTFDLITPAREILHKFEKFFSPFFTIHF